MLCIFLFFLFHFLEVTSVKYESILSDSHCLLLKSPIFLIFYVVQGIVFTEYPVKIYRNKYLFVSTTL